MRSALLCCMLVICFHFLPFETFCQEDKQFEECKKASYCGNQTIRFPFYTEDIPEFCGFPGFNLTCLNNQVLLLNISEAQYRISQIFYSNYSFRVSNVLSSRSGFCSLNKIRDLSLPTDHRFELYGTTNLTLLSNCTSEFARIFSGSKVGCDAGENDTDWVIAMKGKDSGLKYATKECKTVTVAPVLDYTEDSTNFLKLIRDGFDLKWVAADCSDCEDSGGYCGFEGRSVNKFKCFCKDRPHSRSCKPTTGVAGGSILLILALVINHRRLKATHNLSLSPHNASSYPRDVEAFIRLYGSSIPQRFRYSTLKKVTNSFKDELGKGGYGNVYRGRLADGRVVAVKVLKEAKGNGEEFINEVASIGRTSHVNVVTLLGFCYERKRRALIYEFMPNGSLEKFIYDTTPSSEGQQHLGWEKLYSIAIGIARGLEYLHRGCNTRILHFDIKPHNILLDENFRPKISDFGLAKLYTTDESIVSSLLQARGTIGYIAPEVTSRNFGPVSHKSDVYSYGMMILEMVGGRKNVNASADHTSEIYYPCWLYKRIQNDDVLNLANEISAEENEIARKMVIVGLWCIQIYPSQRPSISKVIEMLEGRTALEIPPRPYLCSVPTSPSNSQRDLVFCSSSGTEAASSA
ncbi:hypothetical protein DCAR_0104870 [Daucus carota subsp. sativus]|uniref:non-specific serine/threonine protein kinase n=1 Tax=Daucus carota subsp. sativus TaxID=79200 RepID=A0AAF1AJN5_DAUCS|nr:hypothetical protein DCAR_0104870 [Daucus carota subsp. sativus]